MTLVRNIYVLYLPYTEVPVIYKLRYTRNLRRLKSRKVMRSSYVVHSTCKELTMGITFHNPTASVPW